MTVLKTISLSLMVILFSPSLAIAADDMPLEITADSALEWNQAAKTYTANGNAKAVQGASSVQADKLIAYYDESKGGATNITRLEATGHVNLKSGSDTATGEKVTYDLVNGVAVLDGGRVKIIQQEKNTLEADKIILTLEPSNDPKTSRSLKKAEAEGNVIVTNGGQIGKGDKAIYTPEKNTAELIGRVKITQENNWLEGDKAEINLTTHISRLTKKSGKGQVKGVFMTKPKESK